MIRKRLEWTGPDGTHSYSSLPLAIWLLDQWFGRHPHWEWWHALWMRLLPNWGDPICAAYCCVFSNWVYSDRWHKWDAPHSMRAPGNGATE